MTGEVVDSILEDRPELVLRRLLDSPQACGLVEIRADRLRAGDIAGIVARAGRRVVVTVRGPADGGSFEGSVEEKREILTAALGAGAAFVDVEWGGPLADLASGADAPRTILSHHGSACEPVTLRSLFDAMISTRAARLKIVPVAGGLAELTALPGLLTHADRAARPLAAFALGPSGLPSRILALSWGSWGTYGAAARGRETADGQPTTGDLLDVYRVRTISKSTRRFGLAGSPVGRSPSPALHAAAYRAAAIDAVYLPLATRDVDDLAAIAGPLGAFGLEGFGVTIPLKERIAARCGSLDRYAACGSVNTVDAGPPRWRGYNTDAPAALSLLREHVVLSGAAIAVAGAGGTARAIAAALVAAGAHVTLFHRGAGGEATARAAGASSAPWERLSGASWDVLVQATPLGAAGEEVVPEASLRGRMVLDAAYGRQETPLVRAARRRGLAVADGFDLLTAQAMRQFEILTGRTVEAGVWAAAAAPYREGSNA